MPKSRRGESKEHFISRCIPFIMDEGKKREQAEGECYGLWQKKHPKEKKAWSPFSYEVKAEDSSFSALDAPITENIKFNESKMSAVGLLATAERDREGDVFEVNGLDTADHQRNPVVYVDHGQWYPLPIGKTKDEDGNYTVWIDGTDCYQETFFSQKSQVAEQIYHLYCEGILRANSIGYHPVQWSIIPADPANGVPRGKHLLKTKLIEVTWCGIPVNQDAVLACLSKDKICGKSIVPEIKNMLTPYIGERRVMIPVYSGSFMGKSEVKGEPEGTREIPADREGEQEAETKNVKPLGSEVLSGMHEDVKDLVEQYENAAGPIEHERVKKGIMKHLDSLKSMCDKMKELHDSEYGEKSEDAEKKEGEEQERDVEREDDEIKNPEDVDYEEGKNEGDDEVDTKGLIDGLLKSKNLTIPEKAMLKFIRKSLVPLEKVDEYTPAERKKIAELERAINRRAELLNKIIGDK